MITFNDYLLDDGESGHVTANDGQPTRIAINVKSRRHAAVNHKQSTNERTNGGKMLFLAIFQ